MMKIQKMYRVFNELHVERANAEDVLRGWEHKESIKEVYAVAEELGKFVNLELNKDVYLAKTLEEAMEEAE